MRVEIDQSGRIEETNRDTVIAFSNGERFSIRISAKVKRQLLEVFRQRGKPKVFKHKVFALGVVLLLHKSKISPKNLSLIIDHEYPGHENSIKDIIWSRFNSEVEIDFESVGKNSPAHEIAYYTYKKERKEDVKLTYKEIAVVA